jgi:GT2 family glycosyltransferase
LRSWDKGYPTNRYDGRRDDSVDLRTHSIRRDVLFKIGGFEEGYRRPAIEDIELGYRMRRIGYRIFLEKDLQVKHLKQWRLWSTLHSDIIYLNIHWSNMILEHQGMVDDLNLKTSHRISLGLVGLSAAILPFLLLGKSHYDSQLKQDVRMVKNCKK